MSGYLSMVLNTRPAIDEEYQDIQIDNYSITSTSNSYDIIYDNLNIGILGYEFNASNDIPNHYMDKIKTDCLMGFVKDKAQTNRSCFC